jgi:hypothetical protein
MKPSAAKALRLVGYGIGAALMGGGGAFAHSVIRPEPAALTQADLRELRHNIKQLGDHLDKTDDKLDRFNTRLSWLEGATSGALPANSGPGSDAR